MLNQLLLKNTLDTRPLKVSTMDLKRVKLIGKDSKSTPILSGQDGESTRIKILEGRKNVNARTQIEYLEKISRMRRKGDDLSPLTRLSASTATKIMLGALLGMGSPDEASSDTILGIQIMFAFKKPEHQLDCMFLRKVIAKGAFTKCANMFDDALSTLNQLPHGFIYKGLAKLQKENPFWNPNVWAFLFTAKRVLLKAIDTANDEKVATLHPELVDEITMEKLLDVAMVLHNLKGDVIPRGRDLQSMEGEPLVVRLCSLHFAVAVDFCQNQIIPSLKERAKTKQKLEIKKQAKALLREAKGNEAKDD